MESDLCNELVEPVHKTGLNDSFTNVANESEDFTDGAKSKLAE